MADMYICPNEQCPVRESCADRHPHQKGSYCDKPGHYATDPNIYCPACIDITCTSCGGIGYCIPWENTVKIAIDHTKVVGMDEPSIPSPSPSEPTCPNCKAMREALTLSRKHIGHLLQNPDKYKKTGETHEVLAKIDTALKGGKND